ncbi:MAG: DNA polymerase Y family protein [Burkholderiales bacterium]
MLWLALHFPSLPLEALTRGAEAPGPTVIVSSLPQKAAGAPLVLACNADATRAGIRPGLPVSAAHALARGLAVHARDSQRERETLARLAAWALQFTPTLSLDERATVLAEIGGSLRLFGGLSPLLGQVRSGLAELGFDAFIAVAPTATGAALLARAGLELTLTNTAPLRGHLAALSIDLLEQDSTVLDALAKLGVRTLGECRRLPRDGLARRFGESLLDELDRAFGDRPDPRQPWVAPDVHTVRLDLPSPVCEVAAVLFPAKRLLTELCGVLAARRQGITQLSLTLGHEDHAPTLVLLSLSMPSRDPAHLLSLVRERLSTVELPDRVESVSLTATETLQLAPRNFSFFGDRNALAENRLALVERLRARLGEKAVCGLALVPDHRPELAWQPVEPGHAEVVSTTNPRPLWLLAAPKPLRTNADGTHPPSLSILSGPERIESGWWDGNDVSRDYFVASNTAGARFWIFRERTRDRRWFLHGVFA